MLRNGWACQVHDCFNLTTKNHWCSSFLVRSNHLSRNHDRNHAPIMAFALQQISHMHILFMWFLFCSKNEKQKISTLSAIDELWQMSTNHKQITKIICSCKITIWKLFNPLTALGTYMYLGKEIYFIFIFF
jgi:hypothetical protein